MTSTLTSGAPAQTRAAGTGPIRNTFAGVAKSESIKLLSLRSIRWTLAIALVIGAGLTLIGSLVMTSFPEDLTQGVGHVDYLLSTTLQPPIMFLGLLYGVLGVFAISSEYSSGMILSTLAATPKRGRVLTAKLLVVTLISLVSAVVTFLVGQIIAVAFRPESFDALFEPQYVTAWVGSILFLLCMTLTAFGIAGILRSTAGGIAIIAVLTFVLPIAFSIATMANQAWIDWIMNHLPLTLGNSLSMGIVDIPAEFASGMVGWGEAAISMGVWALVFVVPAFFLFIKRDAK